MQMDLFLCSSISTFAFKASTNVRILMIQQVFYTKMWFFVFMSSGRMLAKLDGFLITMLLIFLHWQRRYL